MLRKNKIYLCLIVWTAIVVLLVKFWLMPILNALEQVSQEMNFQQKAQSLFQLRLKDLENFHKKRFSFQQTIDQANALFVNQEAPVEFIEFLEELARESSLFIELSPLNIKPAETDFWPALGFEVFLGGNFPDCLTFLGKLENGPWLVEVLELNIERIDEDKIRLDKFSHLQIGDVGFSLKLKAFADNETK